MRDLRLSVDDLMTALRQQQVFDISQVQFAVTWNHGNSLRRTSRRRVSR